MELHSQNVHIYTEIFFHMVAVIITITNLNFQGKVWVRFKDT